MGQTPPVIYGIYAMRKGMKYGGYIGIRNHGSDSWDAHLPLVWSTSFLMRESLNVLLKARQLEYVYVYKLNNNGRTACSRASYMER